MMEALVKFIRHRTTLIVICALLALAGATYFFVQSELTRPGLSAHAVGTSDETPVTLSPQVVALVTERATVPAKSPVGESLASRYRTTDNFRRFIEDAKQRPEDGGYYYAFRALRHCKVLGNVGGGPTAGQQEYRADVQAARERIRSACAPVLREEMEDGYLHEFHERGRRLGDPLLKAATLANQGESSARRALIQQGPALSDPLFLSEYGIALSERRAKSGELYFDGRWWGEGEQELLSAAWLLVPCAFGWDCGGSDLDVVAACATSGKCYRDREMLIREELLQGDEERLQSVIALRDRIISALEGRRVGAFIPS